MSNKVSVADEVWIATALLHKEHPERVDFEKQEIMARARREKIVELERPGLSVHVSSHAVANKKAQPNNYRILIETGRGRRRLFREGDAANTGRTGKSVPVPEEIPERYRSLLKWYEVWRRSQSSSTQPGPDPLLALAGAGRGIWGEDAVLYVRRLRGDV